MGNANLVPAIAEWVKILQDDAKTIAQFHVSPDGVFYSTREDEKDGTEWAVLPASQPMKLGDIPAAARVKDARFYFEVGNLAHELPSIARLLPDKLDVAEGLNLTQKNLWMSVGGGMASLIHWDGFENILAQVHGSKEFLLWPPASFLELGYNKRPAIQMGFRCCPPRFTETKQKGNDISEYASADIRDPERHPGLQQTSPLLCRVEPGDALVLPTRWHPLVLTEPGDTGACDACPSISNLAVNYWFLPHRPEAALIQEGCAEVAARRGCDEEVAKQCWKYCKRAKQKASEL